MFKKIIIFLLITLLIAAGALYTSAKDYIERNIRRDSQLFARQNDIQLTINDININPLRITLSNLNLFFIRAFTSLSVDKIEIKPSWLKLLQGQLKTEVDGLLYKGTFNAAIQKKFFDEQLLINASFDKLQLSQHIQLNSLGFNDGQLSMKISDLITNNRNLVSGRGEININKLTKAEKTTLNLKPFGLPYNITIPLLEWLDLHTDFNVSDNKISFINLELLSSLLDIRGELQYNLPTNNLTGLLTVSLSQAGSEQIGPILPLISNSSITNSSRSFEVSGKLNGRNAKWKQLDLSQNPAISIEKKELENSEEQKLEVNSASTNDEALSEDNINAAIPSSTEDTQESVNFNDDNAADIDESDQNNNQDLTIDQ